MNELKKTPFHSVAVELGARMVPFAGYEMPVQFEGVIAEHHAVRNSTGLFDVSHMGEVVIEGREALVALQMLMTHDLSRLEDGRASYTLMCAEDGGIIDDLIVYRDSDSRYLLVINAARREEDLAHMQNVIADYDCQLIDESERWGLLSIQGPLAVEALSRLTDEFPGDMAPFDHCIGRVAGVSGVRIARTGYTGEVGFELFVPATEGIAVWSALLAGQSNVNPCGLGARDTLRLEMKYPLYGNDIDLEHTPLEAGLGWAVKFGKSDFIGKQALVESKAAGIRRKWVGFSMEGRGIPRTGYTIKSPNGSGLVTSGTHSPSLGKPIGVGYVIASDASAGTELEIEIRGRSVGARVVKTPFWNGSLEH